MEVEKTDKEKLDFLRSVSKNLDPFEIRFCKKAAWLMKTDTPLSEKQKAFLNYLYELHSDTSWGASSGFNWDYVFGKKDQN